MYVQPRFCSYGSLRLVLSAFFSIAFYLSHLYAWYITKEGENASCQNLMLLMCFISSKMEHDENVINGGVTSLADAGASEVSQ